MTRSAASPRVGLVLRGMLLCVTLLLGSGCAGYHMGTRSLYAPDVETVFVPVFDSLSLRRNLGERLTEAVIKEIELKTPYKVVGNADDADSVLSGRVLTDAKQSLFVNPNDEPRHLEFNLGVEVSWANRRGELLRAPQAVPLPPPLVAMRDQARFTPEVGQSVATAEQDAINALATRIVEMMEVPW